MSEGAAESRRLRLRRVRRTLLALVAVVAATGVFVGTGWAEDAWYRFAGDGEAAAHGDRTGGDGATPVTARPVLAAVVFPGPVPVDPPPAIVSAGDGVKVSTFLGDETRRLYGLGPPPKRLELIWRTTIGSGLTAGVRTKDDKPNAPVEPDTWSGTGWTGQPVIVRDEGRLHLLVGGLDHHLHKIELGSGRVVWEYAFDDIIKGTPTVIEDPSPETASDRYLVLAGSRRGWPSSYTDPGLAPYRAVSFGTGEEVWRLPVPLTASYSRDVDGSGFLLNDRVFAGVESGWFYKLDPFSTRAWNGYRTPEILAERLLIGDTQDAAAHGGNLVLEASPCLLDGVVYVSSGAGHVYGVRRSDLEVVWDYRTGSDLDGTPVPTASGHLLVPVEKQYIQGHGGVLMLDPHEPPEDAVRWFFPTGDRELGDWAGGVIGSVAVNDTYDPQGRRPRLAAFIAIDGNLYVVAQDAVDGDDVPGPNLDGPYRTPRLVAEFPVGGGISTPIMVDDTIVAAAYDQRIHLYKVKWRPAERGDDGALRSPAGEWFTVEVVEKDSFLAGGAFESTPVMWKGRVVVGSRDGALYCVGDR